MKIIDLLKKRENNENGYFKFFVKHEKDATKDDSINWEFENGKISSRGEKFYDYLESGVYKLNHEIEIIEEPIKLQYSFTIAKDENGNIFDKNGNRFSLKKDKDIEKIGHLKYCENEVESILHRKIDELIEKINKLKRN